MPDDEDDADVVDLGDRIRARERVILDVTTSRTRARSVRQERLDRLRAERDRLRDEDE